MPTSSENIAVSIRGLGKSYRIAHNARQHSTLAEAISDRIRHPFRREERETFWALRDVSAEIRKGEVVGIIGQNGAGKSTLLKILSRITEPTAGEVDLHGRVGSLLEVGTGFHRELTGRENIYLNGAILGMTRREIRRRFDEIVEFSGVEQFLDTPVKRYSSGMYVRLAFAVAAHLDPEILIVDEVLAVGDVGFQRKCLERIEGVAHEGRTVLLVSHNIATIHALAQRCFWLDAGRLVASGPTPDVTQEYLRSMRDALPTGVADLSGKTQRRSRSVLKRIEVLENGRAAPSVPMGAPLAFRIHFAGSVPIRSPQIGIGIQTERGERVVSLSTLYSPQADSRPIRGGVVVCRPEALPLNQGKYNLTVTLVDGHHDRVIDRVESACAFEVVANDVFGTGVVPGREQGTFYCRSQWEWCADTSLPTLCETGGKDSPPKQRTDEKPYLAGAEGARSVGVSM